MAKKKVAVVTQAQALQGELMLAEGQDALSSYSTALSRSSPILRQSTGSTYYRNQAPGVHVRDDFTRSDYEYYRSSNRMPRTPQESMLACNNAYNEHGIVRNIIDLMTDFTTQGVRIVHENPTIDRFYKRWFEKISGEERSQHFVRSLYLNGNVAVKRNTAKVPLATERQMRSVSGANTPDVSITTEKPAFRIIPWSYTFLNPCTLEILADELTMFVNPKDLRVGVKVPRNIVNKIRNPKTEAEKSIVEKISKEMKAAALAKGNVIPLSPDKVSLYQYKKNDWDSWATPMLHPILTDLNLLTKLKLADASALDGVISCIRVWKLGDIASKMFPTAAAVERLSGMLQQNVSGGVLDIIWGPELSLLETSSNSWQFLGHEKYGPTLSAIYAGLGVPATLAGSATQSGFTNNALSLKTLTERLQYGRSVLASFWKREIEAVQKSMGFAKPAKLEFDHIVLNDEAAEKKLYMDLCDRGMISEDRVLERFGEDPTVEAWRRRREDRQRETGKRGKKVGPFHQDKGVAGEGRPTGSDDSGKRKQKRVLPRGSSASAGDFVGLVAWADSAQTKLHEIISKPFLASLGKKSLRELTTTEAADFESVKFSVLSTFRPGDNFDQKEVCARLKDLQSPPEELSSLVKATVSRHVAEHGREPTVDMIRRYQSAAFACWSFEDGTN